MCTELITKFVDERLISFRDQPKMWDNNEVIEFQAITLLEIEALFYGITESRYVLNTYIDILNAKYKAPNSPYIFINEPPETFAAQLYDVCNQVRLTWMFR